MTDGRFQGQVVVVTGATSGIGWEIARAFKAEGAAVVGAGRDQARLGQIAPDVDLALTMDVTSDDSVAVAAEAVRDRLGPPSVLVNNAGVGLFEGWEGTSLKDYQRILDTNLLGAIRATQAFLPDMIERKAGTIVNIASVAGLRGYARHTAYCASKHALVGYSRALQKDLRGTGVRVVVVCPPAVDTPFFENAGFSDYREKHRGLALMSPAEVARQTLDAAASGERQRLLSARSRALWLLDSLAPRAVDLLQRLK